MGFLSSYLFNPLISAVSRSEFLAPFINRKIINGLVNVCRNRPHPWSTVHDYVSWTSLTDKTYSARHLPVRYRSALPPIEDLMPLFQKRGGSQRHCEFSISDGWVRAQRVGA